MFDINLSKWFDVSNKETKIKPSDLFAIKANQDHLQSENVFLKKNYESVKEEFILFI